MIAFLAEQGPIIIAGMFGGILRWAFLRTKRWDGLLNIALGGGLAYYGTPGAAPILAQYLSAFIAQIDNLQQITAVIIGLAGMHVVGWIIDVVPGILKRLGDKEQTQ